jgi:hypothetical protein
MAVPAQSGGFFSGLGGLLAPNPSADPEVFRRQQIQNALLQAGLGGLGASQQPGATFASSLAGALGGGLQAAQQSQQNAFAYGQEKRRQEKEDRLEKAELARIKVAESQQAAKDRETTQGYARRIAAGLSNAKGREIGYLQVVGGSPEFRAVAKEYGFDPAAITTPEQAQALAQELGSLGALGADPKDPTSEPLEAIIDPRTKQPVLQPRSKAVGATPYYRPSNALAVTLPDGTVISDGPPGAVSANELTKPTVNKLQESIVGAQDRLDRLNSTLATYKPEFLQARGLLKAKTGELAEFLGGELDPESKQFLSQYSEFKATAANDFNQTLRELSGAAVTDGEAKRALAAAPSPEDRSPTQFEAKAKATTKTIRRAILRANYALKNGIGTKSVDELSKLIPLEAVDAIYEARVNEIYEQLGGTDEVRQEAIKRANQEFGIAR